MSDAKLIPIPYEMIEQIINDDLKEALECNIMAEEEHDPQLSKSLKVVLKHFMPYNECQTYLSELALTELAIINKTLGLYGQYFKVTEERPGS
jgi:hypothetical protein